MRMKKVNKNLVFYFVIALALAAAGITSILARSRLVSLLTVSYTHLTLPTIRLV